MTLDSFLPQLSSVVEALCMFQATEETAGITVDSWELCHCAHTKDAYLKMVLSCTCSISNATYCNQYDADAYNDLALDTCVTVDGASSSQVAHTRRLSGELHILLHPVYQVPSPYMRMWDQAGNLLSVEEVQTCVEEMQHQRDGGGTATRASAGGGAGVAGEFLTASSESLCEDINTKYDAYGERKDAAYDARHYEFGRLMPESHPFLDTPFCTIHVCTLTDRMRDVMHGQPEELYLLNWLALVGPHIGLCISSKMYDAVKMKL